MPGFHSIFGEKAVGRIRDDCFDESLLTEEFTVTWCHRSRSIVSSSTHFKGYPFASWERDGILAVVEGAIYNFTDAAVREQLDDIADAWIRGEDFSSGIRKAVDSFDGDFVVQLFDVDRDRYLVFNDRLNRLPFYYYLDDDLCVVSKEIRTVLEFMPAISVDRYSLVDYLRREYTFGDSTIFNDVFRSCPASVLEIEKRGDAYTHRVSRSSDFTYELENPFPSKEAAVRTLVGEFLAAVRNRVSYAASHDLPLIADLSGGFDTRAVMGGLSRFTRDVGYYTFQYIRDESVVSEPLFERLGRPGYFCRLRYDAPSIDGDKAKRLVYLTDGLVNINTTYICFKDVQSYRDHVGRNAMRFGGLGGEYIRHPYRAALGSIYRTAMSGLNANMPVGQACGVCGADEKEYRRRKRTYFHSYPEKKIQARLKRLYDEYYHNYVTVAEERERMHFWIAHPLQGGRLHEMMMKRVPLKWASFEFFTDFLRELDEALLDVPIFGKDIDLKSSASLRNADRVYRAQTGAAAYVRNKVRKSMAGRVKRARQAMKIGARRARKAMKAGATRTKLAMKNGVKRAKKSVKGGIRFAKRTLKRLLLGSGSVSPIIGKTQQYGVAEARVKTPPKAAGSPAAKKAELDFIDTYIQGKEKLWLFDKKAAMAAGKPIRLRVATLEVFFDALMEKFGDKVDLRNH